MANALAVRETQVDNPANFGDKHAIAAVRNRIMQMMPGASDAPPDVVWAAAQLAVAYRLDPFNGEIYIMKLGKKNVGGAWIDDYRAHVGVKGLRKKAREQAQFMTDFRDLSPEEVKIARRGDYDPGDVGVECTLWRMDIAQQCARIGIPYKPFRATGFWRVNAVFKKNTSTWEPDGIPNTWTAHDVAEKRAEINAIKRAYDLTINVADPAMVSDDETAQVIGQELHRIDINNAGFAQRDETREDDGDALYYDDEPAHRVQRAPATANADEDTIDGAFSELAEDQADEAPDILDDESVHEVVRGFVVDLRKQDAGRPASDKQHKYAVGIIDGICGKDAHRPVLGAIFGREVGGDRPLAESAAKAIFRLLSKVKSIKIDGEWKKTDNSEYSTESVEFVCAVAKWAGVDMAEKVAA